MKLIEKKKADLQQLVEEVSHQDHLIMETDKYLHAIIQRSIKLARIVHAGQKDKAGKPYIQHPIRVASKGSSLLGFCAGMLHDVVEDGKEISITLDFLRSEMRFPSVLVDIVDALSRCPEESYSQYITRLTNNHQAIKVKLEDSTDNANVTRFDNPTRTDQLRCASYVEKAWHLKSSSVFQKMMQYDFLQDLLDLHKVAPMVVYFDEGYDDAEVIYERFYFGYEGYANRRYKVVFNAAISPVSGEVTARIDAYPCFKEYADNFIYAPRRQMVTFATRNEALDYCANLHLYIGLAEMKKMDNSILSDSSLHIGITEESFVKALDQHYA